MKQKVGPFVPLDSISQSGYNCTRKSLRFTAIVRFYLGIPRYS